MSRSPWLKPHHFQKGVSGNPGGKPKLPPELRGILSLTQTEIIKLVSKYARMTKVELESAAEDPKTAVIDLAIASIFCSAIKYGDYARLAFLLDRTIGKPEQITEEHESELAALSNEELAAKVKELLPKLERGA